MTDIMKLAKQAGIHVPTVLNTVAADKDGLTRFATLVRNAALDEASQKCRTPHGYFKDSRTNIECALAIESLKEPTP